MCALSGAFVWQACVVMRKIKVYEVDVNDVGLQLTDCCGIEELYDLREPNVVLCKVDMYSERRAMIIFHDKVSSNTNGVRLARKIRREKLGSVQASKKKVNPNSGNMIRMWIWYPDFEALDNYCDERLLVVY